MDIDKSTMVKPVRMPSWLLSLLPLVLLGLLAWVFSLTNPLSLFTANLPPVEQVSVERVVLSRDGFELRLLNSGPTPVNIAQVTVDDAFWQFTQEPAGVLPRLGRATLTIPFHWVANDLYNIRLITSTGLTFDAAVPVATQNSGGRRARISGVWAAGDLHRYRPDSHRVIVVPGYAAHAKALAERRVGFDHRAAGLLID